MTAAADRSVLLIAYHFPPLAGSSGIQRALRLAQHLPSLGWRPLVLTAHPRAYERTSADLLSELPPDLVLRRAFALDARRHLSIGGRYLAATARPDRWASWRFDAIRQGLALIRRHRPRAIWSTYPIATAHLIGQALHRRTRLPWIADFRDPMAQDGYPADPVLWRQFDRIEREAVAESAQSVFTTPGAAAEYRRRYPAQAGRIVVIENGFDEESFAAAEAREPTPLPLASGVVTLLHSGVVYPEERDPAPLMRALRRLNDAGLRGLRLRFRAAGHDDLLSRLAAEHGVQDSIETLPPVPYAEALSEMRRADGLLVMQGAGCNEQIPAKVYEYLRAGRPILCLADPAGDTAGVVRDAGLDTIARLDDETDIERALADFVAAVRDRRAPLPRPEAVRRASRRGRSEAFAALLERLA